MILDLDRLRIMGYFELGIVTLLLQREEPW